MSEASPTRMNYLARRSRLTLAARGVDLLKKKRDALVAEFAELMAKTREARRGLADTAREAYLALLVADSFEDPLRVEALSHGRRPLDSATAEIRSIWGSKVPLLHVDWPEPGAEALFGLGGETVRAQVAFGRFAQALVAVANTEIRLRRLGTEIKKTTRRMNALDQVVIPGIRRDMHFIQEVLEQREREDTFRLKRIKHKLEARGRRSEG